MCTGTPLRMALEARGDLGHLTKMIADDLEARLGAGPVVAPLAAHVVEATPARA